jgi:hypothetical protein
MGRLVIIVAKFGFVFLAGMCLQDTMYNSLHKHGEVDLKEYSKKAILAEMREKIRKRFEKETG